MLRKLHWERSTRVNKIKQNSKLLNFVLTKEIQTRVRTGYLKKGGIHAWLTLVNSYQIKTYLSLITDHDEAVKSSIVQVWFKTYIKGKYFFKGYISKQI